jgi:hypothetical protein
LLGGRVEAVLESPKRHVYSIHTPTVNATGGASSPAWQTEAGASALVSG